MDTTNHIAEFLTSRRARITPEQAGLPTYGRRQAQPDHLHRGGRVAAQQALDLLASWTATPVG